MAVSDPLPFVFNHRETNPGGTFPGPPFGQAENLISMIIICGGSNLIGAWVRVSIPIRVT